MECPRLSLNDGNLIPMPGFGTGTTWFKDDPNGPINRELIEAIKRALRQGFIHIDTADSYGTEREVGIAIKESGIPRDELFLTTKVKDGWQDVPTALKTSLEKLQLDSVDLYLHNPYVIPTAEDLQNAWKGLEAVKAKGEARSIGVSNFERKHLEAILETCSVVPVLNQLEYHPYLQRAHDYVPWMRAKGIEVSSFKTLAPIAVAQDGPLSPVLSSIATKHSTTPGAVVLSWAMSQNIVPITTTSKEDRMKEYLSAVDLALDSDDLEEFTQLGLQYHFRWWGKGYFDQEDRS